jgi:hypothetical protein
MVDTAVQLAEDVGEDPAATNSIDGRMDETIQSAGLPDRPPGA